MIRCIYVIALLLDTGPDDFRGLLGRVANCFRRAR
jgi:hypothetical protein